MQRRPLEFGQNAAESLFSARTYRLTHHDWGHANGKQIVSQENDFTAFKSRVEKETVELKQLDEDSDEYMERANDLMVLDTLISKIDKSQN